MCLRLSLLSLSHHLCSICSNRLLFLAMQIDFILKLYFEYILIPSWSSNMPSYPKNATNWGVCPDFFSHCFTLGLTFGFLKKFGGTLNTTWKIMAKAKFVLISYNENTNINNKTWKNMNVCVAMKEWWMVPIWNYLFKKFLNEQHMISWHTWFLKH